MLSERHEQILVDLSYNPYKSMQDMMDTRGWKRTSLRHQITSMEDEELISHVKHPLEGRNPTRRYHLTREGVTLLAADEGELADDEGEESESPVMERVGTTGWGLSTYHTLIDILAGVYRCGGTIARCYETPRLGIHLFSAGPMDAVVRLPDSPYSLGVMVYRRALSLAYFERKLKKYAALGNDRPSCLLVISPGHMADHTVAHLVAVNYGGRAEIAPLDEMGHPGVRVWRDPGSYDEETRPLSTWDMLDRIPDRLPNEPVRISGRRRSPSRARRCRGPGGSPRSFLPMESARRCTRLRTGLSRKPTSSPLWRT